MSRWLAHVYFHHARWFRVTTSPYYGAIRNRHLGKRGFTMTAPEPADGPLPPTSQVVRILSEFLEDLEAGAPVDPEELAAQCPELAEPLKGCLASLKFLQEAVSEQSGTRRPGNMNAPAGHDHLSELGRFGDFRLIREVGRGGMGIVY